MTENDSPSTEAEGNDSVWPLYAVYGFMWAGMIGPSLNSDAIKFDWSIAILLGLAFIVGMVIYFVVARLRRHVLFGFSQSTVLGNLKIHIFIITGIVFISYLFFFAVVQIMILTFGAPLFASGCDKISQRDTALFVWEAMAKGAFKFLTQYLPLPAVSCAPSTSWTALITAHCHSLVHGARGGLVRRELRKGLVWGSA